MQLQDRGQAWHPIRRLGHALIGCRERYPHTALACHTVEISGGNNDPELSKRPHQPPAINAPARIRDPQVQARNSVWIAFKASGRNRVCDESPGVQGSRVLAD